MQIGCCYSLSKENARWLKAAGSAYLEGGFSSLAALSAEEARTLAEEVTAVLPVPVMNLMFPGELKLVGESVNYAAIDCYLEETLEKAVRFGTKKVVFGSGGPRRVPEGFSHEIAFRQLVTLCREHIAPAFERHGMVCCVEPLNRRECNILTTSGEVFRLVQAVDHPAVRLLIDLYHFDLEQEPLACIENYRGAVGHVHIASAKNARALPKPGDSEDYAAFFAVLKKAGYDGLVSLEGTAPDLSTAEGINALAGNIAYLKQQF